MRERDSRGSGKIGKMQSLSFIVWIPWAPASNFAAPVTMQIVLEQRAGASLCSKFWYE